MKKYYLSLFLCFPLLLSAQIYVDHQAIGDEDGSSWEHAFVELQKAINAASVGDEIWVAEGTYYPTFNRTDVINGKSNGTQNKNATFFINKDIKVYGGFSGVETQLNQRDPSTNVTVLSGDYQQGGNRCYHVVYLEEVSSACLIDGCSISDGQADSSSQFNNMGGGIFVISNTGVTTNPTINNCIISNNSGFYGGGIYNKSNGGESSPIINNCQFNSNSSDIEGGAMYNDGNGGTSSPQINNSSFTSNVSEDGGAVFNIGESGVASPIIDNCTFSQNSAPDSRGFGGFYSQHNCNPTIVNSILWGNSPSEICQVADVCHATYFM